MKFRKFQILRFVALLSFVLPTAGFPQNNERRMIGPEVTADLIIYFKKGVTEEKINTFWENVLSTRRPDGKGYDVRRGVGMLGRESAVQGHEGISLSYFPNATQAQRDDQERDVKSSPLVYKILRNTAPMNVKTLTRRSIKVRRHRRADGYQPTASRILTRRV